MNLVPLANWQDPIKRRLEAIRAAHERDEDALWELVQAYVLLFGRKQAATRERTLRNYKVGLKDYLAWAWPPESPGPQVHLLKATRDDLRRYIAVLQLEGSQLTPGEALSPGTIALRLVAVRVLYRALEWAGAASALEGIPAPSNPTPAHERRPALPPGLYKKLVGYLEGSEPVVLRDRLAVRLLGECGLRISEVVGLEVGGVLLEQQELRVLGKGGKTRTVPLPSSLLADFGEWLKLRSGLVKADTRVVINLGGRRADGRGMTVRTLSEILRKHYQELGFPEIYYGAHSLRHTAGTRMYKSTRDLHRTAALLGHASVNTSAIYAKMDLEGLHEAMQRVEEALKGE